MSKEQQMMDNEASSQSDEEDPMRMYIQSKLGSPGWIRLLKLVPARPEKQVIACILEEHNFKAEPVEFEALSWFVGNRPLGRKGQEQLR